MIDTLRILVYQLTNLLLWPVVVLLLFGMGHTIVLAGEALWEARRRRRPGRSMDDPDAPGDAMAGRVGIAIWARERARDPEASPYLVLDRTEAALAGRVHRARLWNRLGPALGLAGTLIPLGPGLTALARSDLEILSRSLVLAFGTTVLGLFSGALGWVIATSADRWYRLDLAELRHAVERQQGEVGS
jgi:biopolymer transport protein ExbB/TolQ